MFPCFCFLLFFCFLGTVVVFWPGTLLVFCPKLASVCSPVLGVPLLFEQVFIAALGDVKPGTKSGLPDPIGDMGADL